MNGGLLDIKVESDDFHDSMVDVSKQIENNSDNSELSQNLDKFDENIASRYYYKSINLTV